MNWNKSFDWINLSVKTIRLRIGVRLSDRPNWTVKLSMIIWVSGWNSMSWEKIENALYSFVATDKIHGQLSSALSRKKTFSLAFKGIVVNHWPCLYLVSVFLELPKSKNPCSSKLSELNLISSPCFIREDFICGVFEIIFVKLFTILFAQ